MDFFKVHELHRRRQVGPGHGAVALVAAPLLRSRRGHLSLREFKSGCIRRCGCVRIGFCQNCRLAFMTTSELKTVAPQTTHRFFELMVPSRMSSAIFLRLLTVAQRACGLGWKPRMCC
jgi:hypothetical protein